MLTLDAFLMLPLPALLLCLADFKKGVLCRLCRLDQINNICYSLIVATFIYLLATRGLL